MNQEILGDIKRNKQSQESDIHVKWEKELSVSIWRSIAPIKDLKYAGK